ncbi:hypothetical protein B0H14DRAFT_2709555 [Mycena olivaceomarginata]|nr:hypothetical protein B0H14DRAFT_2709555 [Mycena olivaceomarginata]
MTRDSSDSEHDRKRHLVLRPPQFGQTMFLSTLYYFYDIHGAPTFRWRFGSLAVVTEASTPIPHSQPLCLSFNLPCRNCVRMTDQIGLVLDYFLISMLRSSGYPHPGDYLEDEEDLEANSQRCLWSVTLIALNIIFDILSGCCQGPRLIVSLFAVDNYDAPDSDAHSRCCDAASIYQDVPTPREIEQLLDSCFWRPLMAATDVVHKMCCLRFMEEEALYFMRSLLDETLDVTDLRRSCGYYDFSPQNVGVGTAQPLLHPRLLINRIFELSLPQTPVDKDSFRLLLDLLETLPEELDVSGAITVDDVIGLLATGATVNWSALHSAGALTYDRHRRDVLRVANSQVLSLIHSRVDNIHPEDPQFFLELLMTVFRDLVQRCFGRKHEPNLRGIFELIMRNPRCIQNGRLPGYQRGKVFALELKTLTLRGMWQAAHPNDDEPTVEALKALHEELVDLPEDDLLARPYTQCRRPSTRWRRCSWEAFLGAAGKPQFLAVGGARILLRRRPRENDDDSD